MKYDFIFNHANLKKSSVESTKVQQLSHEISYNSPQNNFN